MTKIENHPCPLANGWVALHRSEETLALLENYPNAFLLMTQIALRAKWKDCPITGLKTGEALIGDWKKAGLRSPKAYQNAKIRLEKCGLATFQGGNKGTRAKLVDSRVFSITTDTRGKQMGNSRGGEEQSAGNTRGTNHKETRKSGNPETPQFAEAGASSDPAPRGFGSGEKATAPVNLGRRTSTIEEQ